MKRYRQIPFHSKPTMKPYCLEETAMTPQDVIHLIVKIIDFLI